MKKYTIEQLKGAIFGLAVGDALGVPAEFKSREALQLNPIKTMQGHGTHNQPAGTWSDDSSLTFCLMESLAMGVFNTQDMAERFSRWLYENYWTPHGRVFDSGITTRQSIDRFTRDGNAEVAGSHGEYDNGNGSLMRILPLTFYVLDMPIEERFLAVKKVSSITHGHIRSVLACFFYVELAINLIKKLDKRVAYEAVKETMKVLFKEDLELQKEKPHFRNLIEKDISTLDEKDIKSSGYVIHTLEASLWCFLKWDHYSDIVLKAVNLGEDTDTTGAVVGGWAGLYYGYEKIPSDWVIHLARERDINDLCERFYRANAEV